MDIGFAIYGALMILCAERAFTHARQRRFDAHRAWAIRLFALTVGSWLYRMEYALWYLVMGDLGTDHFRGWFDAIMTFFFYIPNLAVAEFFIRAGTGKRSEEHTSEIQSLKRISYAVFCLKKKKH